MTHHEPAVNDMNAALDASTLLITTARADLVNAIKTYDAKGPRLAKIALERVQSLKPAASPAREAAAAGLTEELRQFGDYWVPLGSDAGLLLNALVNNLAALGIQMMSPQFPSEADTEGFDAMARARASMAAIDEAVKRNEIIMACAVVSETEVSEAVQEIARLLIARLNLLTAFLHRTEKVAPPDVNVEPNWIEVISKPVRIEAFLQELSPKEWCTSR